jgi:hypothetical protein
MRKEFSTIEVTPVGDGVYRVFSLFDKDSIAVTAHALLALARWVDANSETLAHEAGQEQGHDTPRGADMLP